MKKIKVNNEICIGCGACQAEFPDNFQINDEGVAEATENNIVNDEDGEIMEDICPVGAIVVNDNEIKK